MLKLLKQYKFVLCALVICLIGIGSMLYEKGQSQEFLLISPTSSVTTVGDIEIDELESPVVSEIQIVPIYICGEIKNPGVYYIQENALINEVINLSGGFTTEANIEYLNLACPIQANSKIVVPKQGEEIDKNLNSYDNKESNMTEAINDMPTGIVNHVGAINLNIASVEELMSLPGIGEKKAAAIKAYRELHGGFKEVSELTKVEGIGDKTFEKIQELIIAQ